MKSNLIKNSIIYGSVLPLFGTILLLFFGGMGGFSSAKPDFYQYFKVYGIMLFINLLFYQIPWGSFYMYLILKNKNKYKKYFIITLIVILAIKGIAPYFLTGPLVYFKGHLSIENAFLHWKEMFVYPSIPFLFDSLIVVVTLIYGKYRSNRTNRTESGL